MQLLMCPQVVSCVGFFWLGEGGGGERERERELTFIYVVSLREQDKAYNYQLLTMIDVGVTRTCVHPHVSCSLYPSVCPTT